MIWQVCPMRIWLPSTQCIAYFESASTGRKSTQHPMSGYADLYFCRTRSQWRKRRSQSPPNSVGTRFVTITKTYWRSSIVHDTCCGELGEGKLLVSASRSKPVFCPTTPLAHSQFACEGIFFFFLLLLNDFDLAPFCNFLSVFCCFSGSVCCIIVGTHSRKCRLIRSATAVIAETLRCRNH